MEAARVIRVTGVEAARDALVPRLRDGDVVLVKASRGVGLDRLVDELRRELRRGDAR
jgi:UDP-N-acetylmuramyl pentapeptide synthase